MEKIVIFLFLLSILLGCTTTKYNKTLEEPYTQTEIELVGVETIAFTTFAILTGNIIYNNIKVNNETNDF